MNVIEVFWVGDVEDRTPTVFRGEILRITDDWIIIKTEDGETVHLNKKWIACYIEREVM